MESAESAEAKGEGENESPLVETEASKGHGKEDPGLGQVEETVAREVPVLNGEDQEEDLGPSCAETPTADAKEGADDGSEAPHPASTQLEEDNPKSDKEMPGQDIPSESATAPPDTPVPSLAVADPSCSTTTTEQPAKPPKAASNLPEPPDFYCVKWINWKGERTPIITQSENGPCPLLAIMNILFLQWKLHLLSTAKLLATLLGPGAPVNKLDSGYESEAFIEMSAEAHQI
uniref:Uncharacterized protein n=1 Tax=Sphaerodactylus townsendi TaxID=933632 RepID=A0ACB8G7Q4_9SAUR